MGSQVEPHKSGNQMVPIHVLPTLYPSGAKLCLLGFKSCDQEMSRVSAFVIRKKTVLGTCGTAEGRDG